MTSLLDEILPHPGETLPEGWYPELGSYLSATRLGMLERCPEQFRRRYLLGEKERPGAALVWGGADHEAHAVNFEQKITSGEDVSVEIVKDAFATAFDRRVEEEGGVGEVAWDDDKGPGPLKDAGVRLVEVYHQKVSPFVQPVAVETEFTVDVGAPVPLHGRVDLRTEKLTIERKTGKQNTKLPKPDWRLQGMCYQLVDPKPVVWHHSVKTKTPAVYTPVEEPGLQLEWSERLAAATRGHILMLARVAVMFYETFGPDEPWPGAVSDSSWNLGACNFCGFRPTCHWWGH